MLKLNINFGKKHNKRKKKKHNKRLGKLNHLLYSQKRLIKDGGVMWMMLRKTQEIFAG